MQAGCQEVVEGWDRGVLSMKKGEKARLTIRYTIVHTAALLAHVHYDYCTRTIRDLPCIALNKLLTAFLFVYVLLLLRLFACVSPCFAWGVKGCSSPWQVPGNATIILDVELINIEDVENADEQAAVASYRAKLQKNARMLE